MPQRNRSLPKTGSPPASPRNQLQERLHFNSPALGSSSTCQEEVCQEHFRRKHTSTFSPFTPSVSASVTVRRLSRGTLCIWRKHAREVPTTFPSSCANLGPRHAEGVHSVYTDSPGHTGHHFLSSWRGARVWGHDVSVIATFSFSVCSPCIKVMALGLLWRMGHFKRKLRLTSPRCWAAARGTKCGVGSQACHSAQLPVRPLGFPDLQAAIWTNIWEAGCSWNPFWVWQPEQRTQWEWSKEV